MTVADQAVAALVACGVAPVALADGDLTSSSPIDGSALGRVATSGPDDVADAVDRATEAFRAWRLVPAPRRGELVRLFGDELRRARDDLGLLVTLEAGKIVTEGRGEVIEMIDICDLATGQSRMLYGKTMPSERPDHRMSEVWQPLGPVAIITAFNFPVAVWAWNAAIALVAGDPVIWKPSELTPLTALAVDGLFRRACERFGDAPPYLSQVVFGGRAVGEALVDHPGVPLVSATGSTAMGRVVGQRVAARFGRSLLELGGNNGLIVAPSADLDLARRAITFGAVGTAGQRCTSLRRLIVHRSIADELTERLVETWDSLVVGDPREAATLVGPLITPASGAAMDAALARGVADGGTRVVGGDVALADEFPAACYRRPALVHMPKATDIVRTETFAPVSWVLTYDDLDEAIALHNDVPQGLASAIITTDLAEAERFTGVEGSDCGIVNVNMGPSGAEIGGAFGGEKETGGGREAGSDSWKAYMRRVTVTVNTGRSLPLAQGVDFGD